MNFVIKPVFSFNLNQDIIGRIKFGKYDGIHECLTAATITDKVIIHNPHKNIGIKNLRISWDNDLASLNFNQKIIAIDTGRLSIGDTKETLLIASQTHVLAYHVDDNVDLFHKEIKDGIKTIAVGTLGTIADPLVFIGGNQYIRGYDSKGIEQYWITTCGNVSTITLFDVTKDGKFELIVGSDDGYIRIFKNDIILHEINENCKVENICFMEKTNILAYTLNNGTIGVYDDTVNLWRIKTNIKGCVLSSFDLLGVGISQLIVGWKTGKVEIRDFVCGDVLYKMNLNQNICSIAQSDYRGNGINDLLFCTIKGEVRGYEKSKVNLSSTLTNNQDQFVKLTTIKNKLLTELQHYESNIKVNKALMSDNNNDNNNNNDIRLENIGTIPANTRLQIGIATDSDSHDKLLIEVNTCSNNNTTIKAVIIYSENNTNLGTFISYHANDDVSKVIIPISVIKDIAFDIHIKTLVGYEQKNKFHVFELSKQIPKFALYTIVDEPIVKGIASDSYVSFKLNERFERICLWINQNFLLPMDIEEYFMEKNNFHLHLRSLSSNGSDVIIKFIDDDTLRFITDNIEIAGNFLQSITHFLNIQQLKSISHFPKIRTSITELFEKLNGLQTSHTNLGHDLNEYKKSSQYLMVIAEDTRLYNETSLGSIYNDVNKLNDDLLRCYTIRQQQYNEMQKILEKLNNIFKATMKLHVGNAAVTMMNCLKEAVRAKNVESICKIIETGSN